jgi:hypothetical protein
MKQSASEINLRYHLALGVENMLHSLDERNGFMPFFNFELIQKPIYLKHGSFDSPHVAGRYLDALGRCASVIELPIADDVYDSLAGHLYESVQCHASGLPWNLPAKWQPDLAVMHNCREVLLGFMALHYWRKDEKALNAAHTLCNSIYDALGDQSHFAGEAFSREGWTMAFKGLLSSPPATTGRMIRSLVQLYMLSNNEKALHLAGMFVEDNLRIAFTKDGHLTPQAGTHVHSILGTLTGILEYGILARDAEVIRRARQIYEEGIRHLHSSFGWAKEFIWLPENPLRLRSSGYPDYDIPRGEANNTGDLVEAALLLGKLGYSSCFDEADRFVRNHLLASQIVDTSWIIEDAENPDTEDKIYSHIAERVRGGFCFGSPNDLISFPEEPHQVNTDLVGGACQALCEAWEAVTSHDNHNLKVNLLFSKDDQFIELHCPRAVDEPITAQLKVAADFGIRVPHWARSKPVFIQIEDRERIPGNPLIQNDYLKLEDLQPGCQIKIWFSNTLEDTTEIINTKEYEVEWRNGTVTKIRPDAQYHSLYNGS